MEKQFKLLYLTVKRIANILGLLLLAIASLLASRGGYGG